MIILLTLIWLLTGFAGTFALIYSNHKVIVLSDLFIILYGGVLGPFIAIAAVIGIWGDTEIIGKNK